MSESRDLKKGMKLNASLAVQIIEHKLVSEPAIKAIVRYQRIGLVPEQALTDETFLDGVTQIMIRQN